MRAIVWIGSLLENVEAITVQQPNGSVRRIQAIHPSAPIYAATLGGVPVGFVEKTSSGPRLHLFAHVHDIELANTEEE